MTRRALALTAAVLALAPAAMAQEPEDELDDEPVPEATAPPGCERGPGTDADYVYCGDPCLAEGDDADYAYCAEAGGGGGEPPPRPRQPTSAVQPLAAQTLPVTGSETWLIGAFGAGLLLAGGGLRIRFRPS